MNPVDRQVIEIKEAWSFNPERVYLVTLNREPRDEDEARQIVAAFARYNIKAIFAPAGLFTVEEQT